jgi:hypothetical protein
MISIPHCYLEFALSTTVSGLIMKSIVLSKCPLSTAFAATSIALAALSTSCPAHAELDGTMPAQTTRPVEAVQTTAASQPAASGAQQTLMNGAVRLRTLTDPGGTTINEYATSTGRIVAYTWEGPTMPDLRALLGGYNASYHAGAAAVSADGNLHASRIVRPDVIVESGGPMRGYVGRAWLPAALPPGVAIDDLQ